MLARVCSLLGSVHAAWPIVAAEEVSEELFSWIGAEKRFPENPLIVDENDPLIGSSSRLSGSMLRTGYCIATRRTLRLFREYPRMR